MLEEPQTSRQLDSDTLYAEVIVPRHFARPFTYVVPFQLKTVLRIGHLVFVPFGRSLVQGAIVALSPQHPPALPRERLKEIRSLATDGEAISPSLLQLSRQVAETYVAPWGQCLRLILPPGPAHAERSRFILTKEGQQALVTKELPSSAELHLLQRLKRRPLGMTVSRLRDGKDRGHDDLLASILNRGWAHQLPERTAAAARASAPPLPPPSRHLFHSHDETPQDPIETSAPYLQEWKSHVVEVLERRQAGRLLVQAASSERLALLRHAVGKTIDFGRKVLVVTGEAARAESLAIELDHPAITTACLHSTIVDNERVRIWEGIRKNQVAVVVGTRSAVFLPLRSIGLIWIDREEDPALKEPKEPRYHARDVAWMRAQESQALLVLGSSHLSFEAAAMDTTDTVLRAPVRQATHPKIEAVDLRRQDRTALLSSTLLEAMREAMARQAGQLLFLNRKAYAGALVCRDCGQVPRCPSCAVAFAYSRHKNSLFCHYCGTTNSIPDLCQACGGARLHPIGEGTERVEEEVKRKFPSASVVRVDGETMRRPKDAAAIWKRIRRREWDVLVGTQILLREDWVPPVGLVGAVQADAGLSLPDFRAAERTYHLLRDAAALALPISAGGRFIIQSYLPSHHVIQAVVQQDEAIFRSEELIHRTALGFPPVLRLIVLHVSGPLEQPVEQAAQAWAAGLSRIALDVAPRETTDQGSSIGPLNGLAILGPARSPVPRLRGHYRRQILVKSRCIDAAAQAVRSTLTELEATYARRKVKFDVDVDPIDMW